MTPDDAFLADIIANPDDDSLRLIYADYLDEYGQKDRAAFIRVQVALAKLPAGDERRQPLEAQERTLRGRNWRQWLGCLRTLTNRRPVLRRGFVEGVTMTAHRFLRFRDALFQDAPLLRDLTLLACEGIVTDLAACPHLARLTRLQLDAYTVKDAEVAALTNSPHLDGLESFDLANCPLSPAGRQVLRERFGNQVLFCARESP